MERRLTIGAALVLAVNVGASGQTFEVASIKAAPPPTGDGVHIRMSVDAARLSYTNVSLRDIIKEAYRVQDDQIIGPEWIGIDRFDIVARIPEGVRLDRVPQMLQQLLAERFGLALHRETKALARYSLSAGKNRAKLQKAEKANGLNSDTGRLCNHVNGQETMLEFTDFLSKRLGRPVVDNTGLDGAFKIHMEWAPEDSAIDGAACGPSLVTALQEQLGLKLNADKGPVEILVIDHVDRKPTDN